MTLLEATVRLVPSPPARCTLALGFADGAAAAEPVPVILGYGPVGVEGFDDVLLKQVRKKGLAFADTDRLPDGRGWLLVEFGGQDMANATAQARRLMKALKRGTSAPSMRLLEGDEATTLWAIRESGLGGTARVPGERPTWPGWEDAAVPPAGWPTTCVIFASCAIATATGVRSTATTARGACTPGSTSS